MLHHLPHRSEESQGCQGPDPSPPPYLPRERLATVIDTLAREITYLRISITDRCNLRCFYCAPVQEMVKVTHADILRYEEFLHLAEIAVSLGMRKLRVTGGEPLIRKGVADFVAALHRLPGVAEVCLTTNGILLAEQAPALWSAGLRRLNISLDSLNPDRYRRLTGGGDYHRVWEGIHAAADQGFHPLKLNCVILRGVNDDELLDFARLSREHPYHIRFIEFMPLGSASPWRRDYFLPSAEILARLAPLGPLEELPPDPAAGPARRFRFPGAPGEIGFISPLSQHFCGTCNRLRLTADGRLRPCLLDRREIDLKGALRRGASRQELVALFQEAARAKPVCHPAAVQDLAAGPRPMMGIGG